MPLIAGIELGGTKSIAVLARGNIIAKKAQWPTGAPAETLAAMRAQLQAWFADTPFDAIGIASFGPLDVQPASATFGQILTTPKPGWSGVDVRGAFAEYFDVPIGFDTDVGAAALAEARWGGAIGCQTHVYITIGTGIGAGIVVDGRLVHGLLHPEIGHIRVRRDPSDAFPGVCPFHGDCLEGLASGPAIAARVGASAGDVDSDGSVWSRVGCEVAELTTMLILTLAPERIIFGGGVALGQPALIEAIRMHSIALLGGYIDRYDTASIADIIRASPLGPDAGPLGAIALGLQSAGIGIVGRTP